jgi:alginate O-acetyltransferase complex protein AlgI
MLFPTIEFAVFFAVVFPITWALNDHNTWKKLFLTAASYVFYAAWRPEFTLLLFISSVFNYAAALLIARLESRPWRLTALWAAIIINLGLLGYFKYYNFLVAQLINGFDTVGLTIDLGFIELPLPVAISFFTFHALSYIIDVYRRAIKPTTSLLDILFYISFFPHLIAGPIVRANKFLAQTIGRRDPANIRLGQSVFLILGGLFKKVIIANYLSTGFVDGVFRDPTANSSLDLILGMYTYALQIYCDFSAYTDIAIGIANLLGYEFPQNFNLPYRAVSFQDFWRRWHISLSTWLRDYLYIPLGGSKFGTFATYRNIMITMALGGLWHGASWAFLIWGCLHGTGLVVERALGITGEGAAKQRSPLSTALGWLVTFQCVSLAWVFFRAPSTDAWLGYFSTMFAGRSWSTTMTPFIAVVFALGALSHVLPPRWFEILEKRYDQASLPVKVLVPFVVIYLIAIAAPSGIAPFIYFQF